MLCLRAGDYATLVSLCDVGTIAFLRAGPKLISDLWQTSCFTKVADFEGTEGVQSGVISIHSTGRYVLEKNGAGSTASLASPQDEK